MLELALAVPLFMGGPDHTLTCDTTEFSVGRALENGDHINMDIAQGDKKFQVNAYVDRNIPGGYDTLGLRFSDGTSRPLAQEEVVAGVIEFQYGDLIEGDYTVEWVQYNSTYFNQDRDSEKFVDCTTVPVYEEWTEVTIEEERLDPVCVDEEVRQVVFFKEITTTYSTDPAVHPVSEVTREWSEEDVILGECLADTGWGHGALAVGAIILVGAGVLFMARGKGGSL